MNLIFRDDEKLYRAVYPKDRKPNFWTKKGNLASAAFKDKKGLSVFRTADRSNNEALEEIKTKLQGYIYSFTFEQCKEVNACVVSLPSTISDYHSEVHGSETEIILTSEQALYLSRKAVMEYNPNLK